MTIKRFIISILMVIICATSAFANHFDNYSKDIRIQNSLTMLEKANAKDVFYNLNKYGFKIAFYDLSQVSYDYANHFAINTVDSFGNRYILINSKFMNASAEEIACIIAHESCHIAKVATLDEETYATETEAYYWQLLKNPNKQYDSSALNDRLNRLAELRNTSSDGENLIQKKIIQSNFYMNQLASN